jgi:alkylation response protein AidB-like acyl-CoA dehydrogenase
MADIMEEKHDANQQARDALSNFESDIYKNAYDNDFRHTIKLYFQMGFEKIDSELEIFGNAVIRKLDPLVKENNLAINLPRVETYNSVGERIDQIVHHPSYIQAGHIIYKSQLLAKLTKPGGLLECLSFLFLSSQAGEAGHNCPIACSAGMIRVLQKTADFHKKDFYLEKLIHPNFEENFTGAQFLTEIQGGSDVAINATYAKQENDNIWRIYGEKWFCSNAGADLIFMTARFDQTTPGTKGLGLFLVPAEWNGEKNAYTLRRLKDKMGTRSMATGEIDFHGAYAIKIGSNEEGFHLIMNNVLHLSRIFNTICVLGMARRAYHIACSYAHHRIAFSQPIIQYPLVIENLARIKTENAAMVAAIFATIEMQDQFDKGELTDSKIPLLLRLLVNMQKYLSALWSFEHIHHSIDVLAGNGMIETFSSLPRLLRDCIVCENWEGTHNVLRMQTLKDILKYNIDQIYLDYMRSQFEILVQHSKHLKPLITQLNKLESALSKFRQLDSTLQTLQIRFIMDSMAQLYCALKLLIEALDQEHSKLSSSKLDCYHYFCLLHIEKKEMNYNNDYLQMITRIVSP